MLVGNHNKKILTHVSEWDKPDSPNYTHKHYIQMKREFSKNSISFQSESNSIKFLSPDLSKYSILIVICFMLFRLGFPKVQATPKNKKQYAFNIGEGLRMEKYGIHSNCVCLRVRTLKNLNLLFNGNEPQRFSCNRDSIQDMCVIQFIVIFIGLSCVIRPHF